MDGAGKFRSFLNVTIPGVRSATTLVVILSIITGANLFTEPYLLTNGGGPDGASSLAGAPDVPDAASSRATPTSPPRSASSS